MHVLSETWVMSRSIQAEKSGLEPKPTSLLQPVTWVTGKEIGLELGQIGLAYFAAPMRGSSYLASNVRRSACVGCR
jgi:phosphoglycerate-specific signal transduction histidine kinase